jgi:hypothetical protein
MSIRKRPVGEGLEEEQEGVGEVGLGEVGAEAVRKVPPAQKRVRLVGTKRQPVLQVLLDQQLPAMPGPAAQI